MANNFDKILELVNAGNQMGLSNTIKRDYGIPLDFTSVQESYEAAVEYAATSAKAYVGQILAAEGVVYIITEEKQEDDTYLKPVGIAKDPVGDGASIEVSAEGAIAILGFAGAENNKLPMKVDGKIVWKSLEDIGAGDGNDNTTYAFAAGADGKSIDVTPSHNGVAQEKINIALSVYTIAEVDDKFLAKADYTPYDDTALADRVSANEEAIEVLNGNSSIEGSVDKKVADAINTFATQISDDQTINTYKELIDYAATHGAEFTELVGEVEANAAAIETLNGTGAGSVDKKIADAIAPLATTEALNEVKATAEAAQTAEEVASAIGTALENVYTKDEVYSKSETDTAIADAVKNATGGESASDVLIELNNYKKAVNRELWGAEEVADYTATTSRIDALETADAAQDTLIASNTTLAQKGVDDAKTASDAVAALASGQVATNKTNIEALTSEVGTHTTDIADLKSKVSTNTSDIAALKADDIKINETLTSHGTDITSLKASVAAHDTAVNTTLPNAIAEKLATETFNTTIANYYTKTEADGLLGNKADKATTYTKEEVDNLLANLDQTEINEAIAANTEAIATLNGNDAGKSARDIAIDEIAKVVNSAPEDFDTLKEIADYIASDKTGAAEINNKLSAHDAILAGIGGTDEPETVSALIDEKIAANAYDLPAATVAALGGVKSAADDAEGNVAANAVYVDAEGLMTIKKVTTDILENGVEELILFGGNAGATAE